MGNPLRLTLKPLLRATLYPALAFSTSTIFRKSPLNQGRSAGVQAARKGQKTLRLSRNKFVRDARPPAPGERKALRKRIVLSNTNAFDVPGLQDLTTQNIVQYDRINGKVFALPGHLVDSLRAVEAFKAGQGWGFFRRPVCLMREESVHIGRWMDLIAGRRIGDSGLGVAAGSTLARVILGDRKVGKSVLLLQAMANAFLRGWIVISFPEGRDLVNAQSEYCPTQGTDPVKYLQPAYTAQLLSQIATGNRKVLEQLHTRLQHTIPGIKTAKPITLHRLAEFGAGDSSIAWLVFQALWRELMAPAPPNSTVETANSTSATSGQNSTERQPLHPHARPPILLTVDNLSHLLVPTEYQTADRSGKLSAIHPFDFALIDHIVTYLSGQGSFTNGGITLACTSESNGRVSDPLKVAEAMWKARRGENFWGPLANDLPALDGPRTPQTVLIDHDIGGLASTATQGIPEIPRHANATHMVRSAEQRLGDFWSPWKDLDMRVMDALKAIEFIQLGGMSKDEARRIMAYWAQSGMVRRKVEDGWVGETWTLAGGGVIGELERSVVRAAF